MFARVILHPTTTKRMRHHRNKFIHYCQESTKNDTITTCMVTFFMGCAVTLDSAHSNRNRALGIQDDTAIKLKMFQIDNTIFAEEENSRMMDFTKNARFISISEAYGELEFRTPDVIWVILCLL